MRYILLKDLPNIKAGEIYTNDSRGCYCPEKLPIGGFLSKTVILDKETVENNPEWFKKVEDKNEAYGLMEEADFHTTNPHKRYQYKFMAIQKIDSKYFKEILKAIEEIINK